MSVIFTDEQQQQQRYPRTRWRRSSFQLIKSLLLSECIADISDGVSALNNEEDRCLARVDSHQ